MYTYLKNFLGEETGAVTIDWVILTAAMASFGISVATIITTVSRDSADGVGERLANVEVNP
ncbi:MAG: hypothetical protein NTX73_16685 [Rhodobacterales bacterium]|jgi:Flp pilus assembly pilin Flp|nr:hypothetical protein [Rhodobacterales bacterium]